MGWEGGLLQRTLGFPKATPAALATIQHRVRQCLPVLKEVAKIVVVKSLSPSS